MSSLSIDRLERLLARVQRNAKLPRTRTQGLSAFLALRSGAATDLAPKEIQVAGGRAAAEAAGRAAEVKPVAGAPVRDALETRAPLEATKARAPAPAPPPESQPEELTAEELPIEDLSAEELGAEEIPIEIGSEVMLDAPVAPQPSQAPLGAGSIVPKTYTAPPTLDELTFSEPPPPLPIKPEVPKHEAEPPPASTAKLVSDAPESIDAAILAATEAQASSAEPGESEPPAVTPPPESGPQVALPPMSPPAVPSAMAGKGVPSRAAPTVEQLGELVELEPPSIVPLELAERRAEAARKGQVTAPSEELEYVPQTAAPSRKLEVREPMQTLVGGFTEEGDTDGAFDGTPDRDQPAGPGRTGALIVPASGAKPSDVRPTATKPAAMTRADEAEAFGEEAPTTSSPSAQLTPDAVARRTRAAQRPVVDVIASAHAFRPQSFVDLLDASIELLK